MVCKLCVHGGGGALTVQEMYCITVNLVEVLPYANLNTEVHG